MPNCSVLICKNRTIKTNLKTSGVSYHRFPKDPETKSKWIDATGRENNWFPSNQTVICSSHFQEDCFKTSAKRRMLFEWAVPTLKLRYIFETELIENVEARPSGVIRDAQHMRSLKREDTLDVGNTISHCEDAKNTINETDNCLLGENEIKVFCPKCDTEILHTAAGIQKDQIKILIAKVYHYFEQEYEELKTIHGDLDLTPLAKFRQRTALATGVRETTILQILKEEQGRNADERQEQPEKRCRACKRSRKTGSSSEEYSSDDNADDNEQSSDVHEVQMLEVKVEPPECYNSSEEPEIYVPAAVKVEPSDVEVNKEQAQTDPISLDVKREPRSDVVDNANETLALNEPAGTKREARKIPRSDVTSTRSGLLGETEVKAEEIEIEEGFS